MSRIVDKIRKAYRMLIVLLQEMTMKCTVVKMSAYFDNSGHLRIANWGDDINYWFFQEISDTKIISYDWSLRSRLFKRPYVMGIGSVLTMFDINNSIVWGSGILRPDLPFRGRPKEVRAVRGPLTRQKLIDSGIDCPEVYGDPALLLPLYYQPNVKKKYKLGIIEHIVHVNNPLLDNIRHNLDVLVIKVGQYKHWLDFVDEINMCETIISSSLHGLIISEAYKIPNVWMIFNEDESEKFFKYHDFFLSLGRDRYPIRINKLITRGLIETELNKWTPSEIDLNVLLNSCPFQLKLNHMIVR